MAILEPELAVLDETDSGLDVDALRTVARGVHTVREVRPELGVLVITHYQRMLDELAADRVHLLVDGVIVAEGGPELARQLEIGRVRRMASTLTTRPHAPDRLDVATLRKDFPLLGPRGQRPPDHLSRLRRLAPSDRSRCSTPCATTTRPPTPTCTAGCTPSPRRPPAASRPPGTTWAGSSAPPSPAREIVFTKNATEALNLVAHTWGRAHLQPGDVVVLTEMEHHANIVPWHMLAEERGLSIRWIPIDDEGQLDPRRPRPAARRGQAGRDHLHVQRARHPQPDRRDRRGGPRRPAPWWWPTAPSRSPTCPTDVTALGVDFLAFSAHKMLGPTGIGVLWGREELLVALPPFLGGGEMILDVRKDGFIPERHPVALRGRHPADHRGDRPGRGRRLPAGRRAWSRSAAHEIALTRYAMDDARPSGSASDIRIFGPPDPAGRGGVLSFAYRDMHPHDISQILDQYGVCVRAGHHCAKPLMRRLGVNATARASFGLYNDESDVDTLVRRPGRGRSVLRMTCRPGILDGCDVVPVSRFRLPPARQEGPLMPGLEDLYREIILDHYRSPRNRGELESPPAQRVEGFNPLCGDEVVVTLDGRRRRCSPTSRSPAPGARSASRRPR